MYKFPKGFVWGNSISAFEYETGTPNSVDPNSDWYVWVHDTSNRRKKLVSDNLPEDGPDYWDLFKTDHRWASWIGMKAWRLNPEWSRVFPKPTTDITVKVEQSDSRKSITNVEITEENLHQLDDLANRQAVERYREIFQDIKENGMSLFVNLYHFSLPLWIHDPIAMRNSNLQSGPKGWLDKKTVIEYAKFAAYISWKFGDVVDMWSTMNEPNIVWLAYSDPWAGSLPPGIASTPSLKLAAYNIAQACARGYDQIKRFAGKRAQVGLIYAVQPSYVLTDSHSSGAEELKRRADWFSTGWFFDAISNGRVRDGFFGREVGRADMKGKVDWIGVNYYSRNVVSRSLEFPGFRRVEGYGFACKGRRNSNDGFPVTEFGWEAYPEGFRSALNLFKGYDKPLFVTENGIADGPDRYRTWYTVSHLFQLWNAINQDKQDKLDIRGYLCWTLIDGFEFIAGFDARFGFLHVDMVTKKRTPRPSAYVFRDIITKNAIPDYLEEYSRYPNALNPS